MPGLLHFTILVVGIIIGLMLFAILYWIITEQEELKTKPMRVELKPKGNVYIDECPNCKKELETTIYNREDKINYCYHCGQKLIWRGKE